MRKEKRERGPTTSCSSPGAAGHLSLFLKANPLFSLLSPFWSQAEDALPTLEIKSLIPQALEMQSSDRYLYPENHADSPFLLLHRQSKIAPAGASSSSLILEMC
jgi:hypothetical protein